MYVLWFDDCFEKLSSLKVKYFKKKLVKSRAEKNSNATSKNIQPQNAPVVVVAGVAKYVGADF